MGPLSGKRILMIEDEAMISLMLVDLLEDAGATVVGPETTLAKAMAMAMAELHGHDADIVHVNLAGEHSWPVAQRLSARGVPFVFTTAYPRHTDPLLEGAPFLAKPYGVRELLAAMEALVSR